MKARYTTIDGQIIAEKRGGTRRFYGADPLGSVVALYDATGTVTDTFAYWPYGEIRTSTGSSTLNFKFCGTWGYYSDATGRLYVRARVYRDKIARWQTLDPLWPGQSSSRYCNGTPVRAVDSTGLYPWNVIGPKGGCPVVGGMVRKCCIGFFWCGHLECHGAGDYWCPNTSNSDCQKCAKGLGLTVKSYCKTAQAWLEREPGAPGPTGMSCIWNYSGEAEKMAGRICGREGSWPGWDKCMHCWTSCFLAGFCGKGVALYAGWCREWRQLNKCAGFSTADHEANKDGVNCNCTKYMP
ncbi:MAG: RHS repeat-associated core domain-containing protein [Fimbriimonadaceae bacterium]